MDWPVVDFMGLGRWRPSGHGSAIAYEAKTVGGVPQNPLAWAFAHNTLEVSRVIPPFYDNVFLHCSTPGYTGGCTGDPLQG